MLKALHGKTLAPPSGEGRALLDLSTEGCWLVDADLVTTFANAALCRMLGYRAEEMAGSHLLSFVDPDSVAALQRAVTMRKLLSRQHLDVVLRRSDGARLYTMFGISTPTDESGAAIGALISVTDITQRHIQEIALENERARYAAATNRVNRFLAMLSASLKDPASAVLGFAQVLEEGHALSPGHLRAYAASCRDAGRQMVRVLDDVGTWARLQLDESTPDERIFDLAGLVQETVEWASTAAARRGVTLRYAADGAVVLADVTATMTVLQHLLDNAVRFSRPGATVTLSATEAGGMVEIRVSDHGVGIPAERLRNLLRLDVPHATPDLDGEAGSGLGLMICEALVARMGGALRIDSSPGKGTTVAFTLPSGTMPADGPATSSMEVEFAI